MRGFYKKLGFLGEGTKKGVSGVSGDIKGRCWMSGAAARTGSLKVQKIKKSYKNKMGKVVGKRQKKDSGEIELALYKLHVEYM